MLRYRLFDAVRTASVVGPVVGSINEFVYCLAREGRHAVDSVCVVRAPVVVEAVGLKSLVDEAFFAIFWTDHGKEPFRGMEIAALGVANDDIGGVDGVLFFRQGLCRTRAGACYGLCVIVDKLQTFRQPINVLEAQRRACLKATGLVVKVFVRCWAGLEEVDRHASTERSLCVRLVGNVRVRPVERE